MGFRAERRATVPRPPSRGLAVPGEGLEPSCSLGEHLILSQARMTNFATPASPSVAPSHARSRPFRQNSAKRPNGARGQTSGRIRGLRNAYEPQRDGRRCVAQPPDRPLPRDRVHMRRDSWREPDGSDRFAT